MIWLKRKTLIQRTHTFGLEVLLKVLTVFGDLDFWAVALDRSSMGWYKDQFSGSWHEDLWHRVGQLGAATIKRRTWALLGVATIEQRTRTLDWGWLLLNEDLGHYLGWLPLNEELEHWTKDDYYWMKTLDAEWNYWGWQPLDINLARWIQYWDSYHWMKTSDVECN